MTSKFKKQQKRQQWSESVLQTPVEFRQKVDALDQDEILRSVVLQYLESSSVFERTEILHRLVEVLQQSNIAGELLDLCVELLFIEPAKQLHKQMISAFLQLSYSLEAKLPILVVKYIKISQTELFSSRQAPLVMLLTTLVDHRTLSSCLSACGIEICLFLCARIESLLGITHKAVSSHLLWKLEECQESVSITYAILSRNSAPMFEKDTSQMINCILGVSKTMFWILQNDVLAREALPSAGVALWRAITLPRMSSDSEASLLVRGYSIPLTLQTNSEVDDGWSFVQDELKKNGTSITRELQKLSLLGRICSLRGILSILPMETLLHRTDSRSCCLLKHLIWCLCEELTLSSDVNFCFHCLCAVSAALDRIKLYLEDLRNSLKPSSSPDEEIDILHDGTQQVMITKQDFNVVFSAIWRHVDDTVVQTERQAISVFTLLLDIIDLQGSFLYSLETKSLTRKEAFSLVLKQVVGLGVRKKGKYALISAMASKDGALLLLQDSPNLIKTILSSFSEGSVCRVAGNCLSTLLRKLKTKVQTEDWTSYWLGPVLESLLSEDSQRQYNMITYFLPNLMKDEIQVFLILIEALLERNKCNSSCLTALVSILRIARKELLIPNLQSIVDAKEDSVISIPSSLLADAIHHESEALHISTLELACIHPKPTDPPGDIDFHIIKEAMKTRSRFIRHDSREKWKTLVESFVTRLKVSMKGCLVPPKSKSFQIKHNALLKSQDFLQWLQKKLVFGLYPGASSDRKILSMELLSVFYKIWNPVDMAKYSLQTSFSLEEVSHIVIGSVLDPWDHLRNTSIKCLDCFPSPLSGLNTPKELISLLQWSCDLVNGPRLKNSDAGARLLAWIYKKYVVYLKWSVILHPNIEVSTSPSEEAEIEFLKSLFTWFEMAVQQAEKDLLERCKKGLVHGVLLTLRYTVEATNWRALLSQSQNSSALRCLLDGFFSSILSCVSSCLTVLDNHDVNVGAEDEEGEELDDVLGPHAQLLVAGTWLSIKELSVVFGTIVQCIPFQNEDGLLSIEDMQKIGQHFLQTLIRLKHNGAIEKTGSAFQVVCEQLLMNHEQSFRELPCVWMKQLINRIKQQNQSWNDIIRRSGGVPYGLIGIFKAEPKSAPKILLPGGMQTLLDLLRQQTESWTSVHAFHIIRHVFNDKQLALDAGRFLADGLQICIESLSDLNWEVRNAASLCFATLTTRMVGYKNKVGTGASQKPISVFEFFFRYPSLLPFFSKELQAAGERLKTATSPVPPSLGPILLLLSRLVPSVKPPVQTKPTPDPTLLLPVLQRCLEVPQFTVRKLAANSLVTLIFKEQLISYLVETLKNLWPSTNNALHGRLLCIKILLSVHRDLKQEMIQHDIHQQLAELSWILTKQGISDAVKIEYIKILHAETWITQEDEVSRRSLRNKVSEAFHQEPSYKDPFRILFLSCCVEFLFQEELPSKSELETSLNHPFCEVQQEILKISVEHLINGSMTKEEACWMQTLMLDKLESTRVPKIKKKCLEGLVALFEKSVIVMDDLSFWDLFCRLYQHGKLLKIKDYALQCLGYFLRKQELFSMNSNKRIDYVEQFFNFVEECGEYSAPASLRLASIKALDSSQIFHVEPKATDEELFQLLLKFWMLLFRFLEDEEVEIQQETAALIRSLHTESPTLHLSPTSHISCIMNDYLHMLSSNFKSAVLLNALLKWVLPEDDNGIKRHGGDQNLRLFDKEVDNRHTEALFKVQFAVKALQESTSFLPAWEDCLQTAVQNLQLQFHSFKKAQHKTQWLAMFTHQANTFGVLYKSLCLLWLCCKNITVSDNSKKEIRTILADIELFPLHPILARAVLEVKRFVNNGLKPVQDNKHILKRQTFTMLFLD